MGELPLLTMLKSRLGYLNERQRVISENVANANTKGFVPQDLSSFSFQSQMETAQAVTPMVTSARHIMPANAQGTVGAVHYKSKKTPDSETKLDGNAVVLEEQMLKMTDARMNYDAAITFYQKSLSLIRMASRAPGR